MKIHPCCLCAVCRLNNLPRGNPNGLPVPSKLFLLPLGRAHLYQLANPRFSSRLKIEYASPSAGGFSSDSGSSFSALGQMDRQLHGIHAHLRDWRERSVSRVKPQTTPMKISTPFCIWLWEMKDSIRCHPFLKEGILRSHIPSSATLLPACSSAETSK